MKTSCMIIGAGPAGVAAAIQLNRYGIESILIEKDRVGGLIYNANLVENYLGFPNGINGPGLAGLIEKQLVRSGVTLVYDEIQNLTYRGKEFCASGKQSQYFAEYVIIATGTKAIIPEVEGMDTVPAQLIHTDLRRFDEIENKMIAIIGAGDAAFDYALNLSAKNSVIIFNRKDRDKALPLLYDRVKKNKRIEYLTNKELQTLSVENRELCLLFRDFSKYQCDSILFAVGRKPELSLIKPELQGVLKDLEKEGKFAMIGDVKNGICRQLSIAGGDGVKAAMLIYRKIKKH